MAIKLIGPSGICGCGTGDIQEGNFDCCNVMDLGVVYEEEPNYQTGDPCEETRIDTIISGNCTSVTSPSPHGKILPYRRACARLVVWTGATITGSSIASQSRIVLYSRQRDDLPTEDCNNPIYCPAENGIYTCCPFQVMDRNIKSQVGGPYNGCVLDDEFSENCEIDCSAAKAQFYKFSVSNCSLDGKVLAGYATAPSDWWFLNSGEFNEVENQITNNNPYGPIEQTIYAHFQVEWKPIRCGSAGGIVGSPCFGQGRINVWNGPCGTSYSQGLKNKDERERAVKITAAIGYSIGGCGYSPQTACQKI